MANRCKSIGPTNCWNERNSPIKRGKNTSEKQEKSSFVVKAGVFVGPCFPTSLFIVKIIIFEAITTGWLMYFGRDVQNN